MTSVNQYGLGWGYLLDTSSNETLLSTWFDGANATDKFNRDFGMGYSRKDVVRDNLQVEQTVTAPFGDDPVLISTVVIRNTGAQARNVAWVENFGGAIALLDTLSGWDFRPQGKSIFEDKRAFAGWHYTSTFTNVTIGRVTGMVQSRSWVPLNASEQAVLADLLAQNTAEGDPPMSYPPPGSEQWTTTPPSTYVLDMSPGAGGMVVPDYGTDCAVFYGAGGRTRPDMLHMPLVMPQAPPGPVPNSIGCVLAAKQPSEPLAPGSSITFSYLWAYDPTGTGAALPTYVAKYAPQVAAGTLESSTVSSWVNVSYTFNGSAVAPWAERETLWNSYMLLSGASFDNGFGERMLDQGTSYRYVNQEQAAARDPAQHLLPTIYNAPWLAKSVLRYLLKMVQKDPSVYNGSSVIGGTPFNLPYSVVNSYMIGAVSLRPSDMEMYILLAASEYILATRDTEFLSEEIPLYGNRFTSNPNVTVADALLSSMSFSLHNVSVGQHGLMRSLTSDWSDCLCTALQPGCTGPNSTVWKRFELYGESVLNAGMATFVFPMFADALQAADPVKYAGAITESRVFAAAQVTALQGYGWNHNHTWLRRAFLSNETGWYGENQMVGVQHSWPILSGAISASDSAAVIGQIDTHLRSASPIGMPLIFPPLNVSGPGEGENGGVWGSLNHPITWAIGAHNLSMAWDEWAKNALYNSANTYPDYWAGIWSSSDSLNSVLAPDPFNHGRNGGWTTSWPTQCTHRHAWPLFSLLKLSGVAWTVGGLKLSPGLKVGSAGTGAAGAGATWSVETPVVSIHRTGRASWAGHWGIALVQRGGADRALSITAALPVQGLGTASCSWAMWTEVATGMGSPQEAPARVARQSRTEAGAEAQIQVVKSRALTVPERSRLSIGAGTAGPDSTTMVDVNALSQFAPEAEGYQVIKWELTCA